MSVWRDDLLDVTPATRDSWQIVDLSPYVSADCVGVAILAYFPYPWGGVSRTVGVRKNGSTDPTGTMWDNSQTMWFCGVDTDKKIQLYAGGSVKAEGVQFFLAGYFIDTEASFLTNSVSKTVVADSLWHDVTCSEADGGSEIALLVLHPGGSAFDVRPKGSSNEVWNNQSNSTGAFVKLDANKVFECKRSGGSNPSLIGWIKDGQGTGYVDWTDKTPGTTGSYVDVDLSSAPAHAVAAVFKVYSEYNLAFGLRRDGNTQDFYKIARKMSFSAVKLGVGDVIEAKISSTTTKLYLIGYFSLIEMPIEEGTVVAEGVITADEYWEEGEVVGQAAISAEEEEQGLVTGVGVITEDEYWEEGEVVGVGVISADEQEECVVAGIGVITADEQEERVVAGGAVVAGEDYQTYREERGLVAAGRIRGVVAMPSAPIVTWMEPAPGQADVLEDLPIRFALQCENGDAVDITSVLVVVNGIQYDYLDSQFTYVPYDQGQKMVISVAAGPFSLEQTVSVVINASSQLGADMATKSYSFKTIWDPIKTRRGYGRIELYKPNEYDWNILTVQEDWVRQGVERFSPELEMWYGRYMHLPKLEGMKFKAVAGDTNAEGKEILDNGWLSVKFGDGSWVPLYLSTEIDLGVMYTNTMKNFFLKLLVPETAQTVKYAMLKLVFTPAAAFLYGLYPYGKALYMGSDGLLSLHPNIFVYRAYVMSAAMWNQWQALGFVSGPMWTDEDKQW